MKAVISSLSINTYLVANLTVSEHTGSVEHRICWTPDPLNTGSVEHRICWNCRQSIVHTRLNWVSEHVTTWTAVKKANPVRIIRPFHFRIVEDGSEWESVWRFYFIRTFANRKAGVNSQAPTIGGCTSPGYEASHCLTVKKKASWVQCW